MAIGFPSSFSVRVVDSWRGRSDGKSTPPWDIPQRFYRARGFGFQVDGVYEFVSISIQPPTYAVAPTPVPTIVILPTVELSGMVGLNGDGTLIYNTSEMIHWVES